MSLKNKISGFTDEELIIVYNDTGSVYRVADRLGLNPQSVHRRLQKAGKDTSGTGKKWTEDDNIKLIEFYRAGLTVGDGSLQAFADSLGRTKQFICRKAKKNGLSGQARKTTKEHRKKMSQMMKDRIVANGHPRGMLGKKHSDKTKAVISGTSKMMWKTKGESYMSDVIFRGLKTRERRGTLYPQRKNVTWKQGWREFGNKRNYYRSRWEANYGRYLEVLKQAGNIKDWEHEPETFWFENIKRGTRSYLPDFKVISIDGSICYHEVKGWMDAKSKTKLKRMAKYHPEVDIKLIDSKAYKLLSKQVCKLIDGWE